MSVVHSITNDNKIDLFILLNPAFWRNEPSYQCPTFLRLEHRRKACFSRKTLTFFSSAELAILKEQFLDSLSPYLQKHLLAWADLFRPALINLYTATAVRALLRIITKSNCLQSFTEIYSLKHSKNFPIYLALFPEYTSRTISVSMQLLTMHEHLYLCSVSI